jgi:hypothetical protein
MRKNPFLTLISVAVAVSLSVTAYSLMVELTTDRRPPVDMDRVETLNSPLSAGDRLLVRIWREKVRNDCRVHSRRMAVNQDGAVFDVPDAIWAGGEAGAAYLDFEYDTSTLPPGDYELRVSLDYLCPDRTYPVIQPSAKFRIGVR